MKFPDSRVLVFCKAPIPGMVKTRLLPALNSLQAADLHRKLAKRMLDCCINSNLAEVELWCSPDTTHEFFFEYMEKGIPLFQQQGADLGERMFHGATHSLAREEVEKVLIIGTDCPNLDRHYLEHAMRKLTDHDAVLGPAEDGGYGLIGLRRATHELFDNITWGSSEVCAETCRKLNTQGYNWSLLPLLWDVDRPEDLVRVSSLGISVT